MRTNLLILAIFMASCVGNRNSTTKAENGETKNKEAILHSFEADFPITDTIRMVKKLKIDHPADVIINCERISDTILFIRESKKGEMGSCYSINNGKYLAKIANLGRNRNEVLDYGQTGQIISGDSIQFLEQDYSTIKVFSIKDILTIGAGDRSSSIWKLPASKIKVMNAKKLDNGLIFGVGCSDSSYTAFFTYDGKDMRTFGKMPDNLFIDKKDVSGKYQYLLGLSEMAFKGDKVVVGTKEGISLLVIDSKKRVIESERYYNKYTNGGIMYKAIKSKFLCNIINFDDNYIYVVIQETDKREAEEGKPRSGSEIHLCVYDWDLKPIKRFALTSQLSFYMISTDCKKIYNFHRNEDLRDLYEGEIKI